MREATQSTKQVESATESMIRQMTREIETIGKTRNEVRMLNAERLAARSASIGNTEDAARLRAVTGELSRLEAGNVKAGASAGAHRAAMQGLSYQAQDTFTMLSMGANPLQVIAIQGGQAAGQMANMGGKMGAVAGVLAGPWGLAFTGGLMVLAALTKGLFDGASAADKKATAAKELTSAIDALSDSTRSAIQTEYEAQRATLGSAMALREKAAAARAATVGELGHARAQLASALAESARPDPSRGQDGGIDFAMAQAGLLEKQIRSIDAKLVGQQRELEKTEGAFRNAQIGYLGGAIAARLDKSTGLTRDYQRQLATLNGQFQKSHDVDAYARARANLERSYTNEKEALDAVGRASKGDAAARAAHNKELREQAKGAREAASAMRELETLKAGLQTTFDPAGAAGRDFADALKNIDKVRAAKMIDDDQYLTWRAGAFRQAGEREAADTAARAKAMFGDMPDLIADRSLKPDLPGVDTLFDSFRDPSIWNELANNAANSASEIERAFGGVGGAIAGSIASVSGYLSDRAHLEVTHAKALADAETDKGKIEQANLAFKLRSGQLQADAMLNLTGAAKGMFKEHSAGYRVMEAAEKAMMAVQLVRTTIDVAGGAAKMFSQLGVFAFPAVAAMGAVMIGMGFGGGGNAASYRPEDANTGAGTVLGDRSAQSESIKRSVDALKDVDTLMLVHSREMASSLRSIDSQIGGFATLLVRAGNIDAGAVGQKSGGVLGALFGSSTSVVGSGLYAGPQALGSILNGGFDASYFSDVQKTKKFLGITTGKSTSTQYAGADAGLENQFTLILREFNRAIGAAAGPLGIATGDIEQRLSSFVFTLGKVDLKDLSGTEIAEKLNAVLGSAADQMAGAAFPGFARFQTVGEGMFETVVRVASSVETVTDTLGRLGARVIDVDAQMGLVGQFDSLEALTSASGAYFEGFYTKAEQDAAQMQRMGAAFKGLALTLPETIAEYRALVEAQDLASSAGQATWATLVQLAPAFADLKSTMEGVKSASDVMAERYDLERKLLELRGDTAAIRALDLAKLDASNRELQQQVWAVEAAQDAAKAADELRKAWGTVGDSIMDEVRRIRGLEGAGSGGGFAALQGRFNAATSSARGGDQDAAKLLPGLSQEMLRAATDAAASRQELARVQAATAASLEATYGAIGAMEMSSASAPNTSDLLAAIAASQGTQQTSTDTDSLKLAIEELRAEVAGMRRETTMGLSAVARSTDSMDRTLVSVTMQSGGDAISTVAAA
jgi:hypothetical protein